MMIDFDVDDALERTAGDRNLLGEVIRFTLEDLPDLIDGMSVSLVEGRFPDTARLAHKARGSAGACGARRLYVAALDLEMAGEKGEVENTALLDSLKEAFDAFRAHPDVREFASLDAGGEASIG
ncbi:MAG: Hpt domain-containing protein [Spirochaetaceae bacterium]|nr:Hpt domain-containing protein [Spirochaetaceae bacterium]MDT8298107.1 Hpt domain-containing protein [Spirochaetaceae bacterium]